MKKINLLTKYPFHGWGAVWIAILFFFLSLWTYCTIRELDFIYIIIFVSWFFLCFPRPQFLKLKWLRKLTVTSYTMLILTFSWCRDHKTVLLVFHKSSPNPLKFNIQYDWGVITVLCCSPSLTPSNTDLTMSFQTLSLLRKLFGHKSKDWGQH